MRQCYDATSTTTVKIGRGTPEPARSVQHDVINVLRPARRYEWTAAFMNESIVGYYASYVSTALQADNDNDHL